MINDDKVFQIIEKHFGKIVFTDNLIDIVSDKGIGIEIKSCQKQILSGNSKFPIRPGRFVLTKPQHTFLIANDGYYVFMVNDKRLLIKCRIIKASLIRFSPVVQWQRIFEIKSVSGALVDEPHRDMIDIPINTDDAKSTAIKCYISKTTDGN